MSYEAMSPNYVKRRTDEKQTDACLKLSVNHHDSFLQVWGCISSIAVGDIMRVNTEMNVKVYKQI